MFFINTAEDNLEKGKSNVESLCPLCFGLVGALQSYFTKGSYYLCKNKSWKINVFGLFNVTLKHEVEIASNRKSWRYGEDRFRFCTYYTSRLEIVGRWKIREWAFKAFEAWKVLYFLVS